MEMTSIASLMVQMLRCNKSECKHSPKIFLFLLLRSNVPSHAAPRTAGRQAASPPSGTRGLTAATPRSDQFAQSGSGSSLNTRRRLAPHWRWIMSK